MTHDARDIEAENTKVPCTPSILYWGGLASLKYRAVLVERVEWLEWYDRSSIILADLYSYRRLDEAALPQTQLKLSDVHALLFEC